MTREEALELFKKASDVAGNYLEYVEIVSMHNINIVLSEIFNDHEAQLKAKDEEIKALKKECEYDQRNASMSQKESAMLLDKIGAVIKLCEEKITDWRVVESGQEKAYQVILSMFKDTKCY